MKIINKIYFLPLLIALCAAELAAQEPQSQPTPEPAPTPAPASGWLDGLTVFGLIRFRPQYESNYDFDKTTDDTKEYVGSKVQLGVQKDFGADLTAKVVLQDTRVWGGQPGSDPRLLQWANEYAGRCFERVGVADIRPDGTRFVWDQAARDYPMNAQFVVLTLRRTGC